MSIDELRAAALALPLAERRKLVRELRDSVREETPVAVPQWQTEELARIEANLAANPDSARPWDEVYKELKAELKARHGD